MRLFSAFFSSRCGSKCILSYSYIHHHVPSMGWHSNNALKNYGEMWALLCVNVNEFCPLQFLPSNLLDSRTRLRARHFLLSSVHPAQLPLERTAGNWDGIEQEMTFTQLHLCSLVPSSFVSLITSLHSSSVSLRVVRLLKSLWSNFFADSWKTESPSKSGEEGAEEESKGRGDRCGRRRGAAEDGVSLPRSGWRWRSLPQDWYFCHN